MKFLSKSLFLLLTLTTVSNFRVFAKVKTNLKFKTENKLINHLLKPKTELSENKKCLFLKFDKGDSTMIYSIATKFILEEILSPIFHSLPNQNYFFRRIPVGEAVVDVPIYLSDSKKENSKIDHFLKEKILNDKIQNTLKNKLKNESKLKEKILSLVDRYFDYLKKEIKFYESRLKDLEFKQKNEKNFFLNYGKHHLNSILLSPSFFSQTNENVEIGYFPDDLLEYEKESKFLEKHSKNNKFLKNLGERVYKNNLLKYKNIIKTYKNLLNDDFNYLAEDKCEKFKQPFTKDVKEKIVERVLDILKFVRTTRKLCEYEHRLCQSHLEHILDVNKVDYD